mgnify:CR=1 FL=1
MIKFKKYYPFWLGLLICLLLINKTKEYSSVGILLAYLIGYFKLTKLHND